MNLQTFDNSGGASYKKLDSLVIRSQKGAASTILDADYQDRHFEFFSSGDISVDSSFQFIGLTFRGGRTPDRGGSILLQNSSHSGGGGFPGFEQHSTVMRPKFVDCVFIDNAAGGGNQFYGQGGAFYIENASPIFENCAFDTNYKSCWAIPKNYYGGLINAGTAIGNACVGAFISYIAYPHINHICAVALVESCSRIIHLGRELRWT